MFLLEFSIKIMENSSMFNGTGFQQSFKDRSCSFNSNRIITISTDKLVNIRNPDLIKTWPFEWVNSKLKYSENFLKVSILPKEVSQIQQHNRSKSLMLFTPFISSFDSLKVSNRYFNINIKLPQWNIRS